MYIADIGQCFSSYGCEITMVYRIVWIVITMVYRIVWIVT